MFTHLEYFYLITWLSEMGGGGVTGKSDIRDMLSNKLKRTLWEVLRHFWLCMWEWFLTAMIAKAE